VAWAYFDASALIKRYVDEAGRREVLQLLRHHTCVTSAVLPVEIRSALRRRKSEGTLNDDRAAEVLRRLAVDRAFWTVVGVTSEVLSAAEALVAVHPLRTLDAVHVASAQRFAARIGEPALLFVSADTRQTAAARAADMTVKQIAS
jgi:predicted nucleic acid-binding protein